LKTNVLCLSARNRRKRFGKELAVNSQIQLRSGCTGLSGGASDSVRCARTSLGEQSTLGTRRRCTAIYHRTVRWCTGLSGEPSTAKSSLSRSDQRRTAKIHRTVRWCTGLSGEPTVGRANGRPSQRSAAQSARDAWPSQRSDGGTGLSGVHRTVSGAPMAPNLQRSAAPN
jgi:hypothetical protein